jgi:hypothetical protein
MTIMSNDFNKYVCKAFRSEMSFFVNIYGYYAIYIHVRD